MVSWHHWHNEPLLVGGLLCFGWLYALLVGPLRRVLFGEVHFPATRACYFAAGLVVFYITVGSPLDALGEGFLFSAHMVQHNLLMYVVPPLLILGLPSWMVDTALNRWPVAHKALWWLTRPLLAGATFTLIFTLWHLPVLYEAALRSKPLHAFEHLSMLLPSMLLWWGFCTTSARVPRYQPGTRLLSLFALMVAQLPLFAVLTFASDPLYPTYQWAPRLSVLSPHEDQVLGGLIMKIAGMLVSLVLMGHTFLTWQQESERAERAEVERHALGSVFKPHNEQNE
jgi:putative membrane protein